ncbi:MAG: aminotransferase class V-fold PLP-dependent enzyme [Candidatus Moeniiplasma glomeromycotorum]|nr:aminotransferase class V-fold PLP-dependent enzyme [Candidatus Moeniiplasma glomeromycotorum]MCE8168080.1 aminotransferase class V-fold PLP-dependent enzyme [Candidatus Moeniiplasma glomeromycotorum]MCE8169611.1 aminotransferase class V-fold PLP-dependent enzyme [Candidatus Moeniiplasma glomeromycotorum]
MSIKSKLINKEIREFFPIFKHQPNLVYLDSAATALKPFSVIQAVEDYYQKYSINTHSEGSGSLAQKVQITIQQTRQLVAQRINARSEEVIFTPSATYAFNILALSLKSYCQKDDKILLTHLEHSSNCYPWQALAQDIGVQVNFLPLDKKLTVDLNLLNKHIDQTTKIVSLVHLSNSLGVINPLKKIVHNIRAINPNCWVIVDACQSFAHLPIDVQEWDIDALVFSGHKIGGPTGIGGLWIKKTRGEKLPEVLWGGGKKNSPLETPYYGLPLVQKFEVGTLPLAQIFGLKKSLEFLSGWEVKEIVRFERELKNYALNELIKLKKIILYNQNLETVDIVLFNLEGFHAHDVADYLGRNEVYVRAGNFCCPFLEKLIGVSAAVRVSFFIYNTKKDIDKLIYYLKLVIDDPQLLVALE